MLVILNRYYEHPKPDRNIILNEVSRLRVAIGASLKASIQRKQVTVELREDVFKHLFGKKGVQNGGSKVLAQEEFSPSFFIARNRGQPAVLTVGSFLGILNS